MDSEVDSWCWWDDNARLLDAICRDAEKAVVTRKPSIITAPATAASCPHSSSTNTSGFPSVLVPSLFSTGSGHHISLLATPDAEESDCESETMEAIRPAGTGRARSVLPSQTHVKSVPRWRHDRAAREKESKSAEELRRELERVSKERNDLRNECAELKIGMKNKDLEIEAAEAEIRDLKKAKLGCYSKDICSTRMASSRKSSLTPAPAVVVPITPRGLSPPPQADHLQDLP